MSPNKLGRFGEALHAFHRREDGMVSIATVVGFTFFLILAGMVANVGTTTRRKVEAQDAADAVAQSAATLRARGLNTVTAANHLVGELQALVILHHAFGGDELHENRDGKPDEAVRAALEVSYELATTVCSGETFSPGESTHDKVKELPKAGATLRDAVVRLQKVYAWTCQAYAISGLLLKLKEVPIVNIVAIPIGTAIGIAAEFYEYKILTERVILTGLEELASGLDPVKTALQQEGIRAVHLAGRAIAAEIPATSPKVVAAVGRANGARDSAIAPPLVDLPVHPEPESVAPIGRSQLVRAAYPWVNHWRVPVERFMKDWLVLSRARHYYRRYSNEFTATQSQLQKDEKGVHLLVLDGFDPATQPKGTESWTAASGSAEAERLFAVFGATASRPPRVTSAGIYRHTKRDDFLTYAQALAYNANPQEPGSGGTEQPRIGWDTLNWGAAVPEFGDSPEQAPGDPAGYPQIRLNWQAKLVPVTERMFLKSLPGLAATQPKLAEGLTRTLPYAVLETFRTH